MTDRVQITYMDALMLSVIPGLSALSRGTDIPHLINSIDFEGREIPTYDQVSYGLARLMTLGYIRATYSPTKGIRVYATKEGQAVQQEASRLRRKTSPHRWARIGENGIAIAQLHGLTNWKDREPEDRSAGRMPRLDEALWDRLVAEYVREGDKMIERMNRGEFSIVERGAMAVGWILGTISRLWRRDERQS